MVVCEVLLVSNSQMPLPASQSQPKPATFHFLPQHQDTGLAQPTPMLFKVAPSADAQKRKRDRGTAALPSETRMAGSAAALSLGYQNRHPSSTMDGPSGGKLANDG